jgi:hypothetical protein
MLATERPAWQCKAVSMLSVQLDNVGWPSSGATNDFGGKKKLASNQLLLAPLNG